MDEYAKRARTHVLQRMEEPVRGGGIPMGGVTVHFPAGLTPHVPQKITMSKAGGGVAGFWGGVCVHSFYL